MATIGKITPELKTLIAKSARDEVRNTSNDDTYYAYIAYTDSEDYPFHDSDLSENVTDSDLIHVYKNIATMHRVLPGGVSRVITRKNWVKNRIYTGWNTDTSNDSDYYVMSTEIVQGVPRQNVYKVLFAPSATPSTVAPTGSSSLPFKTSDNHWWQYMYTITNSDAILFMTEDFMPVPERVSTEESQTVTSGTSRYDQLQVQNNAISGSIFNVRIKHGPNERPDSDKLRGFTSKNVVKMRGVDGTGATPTQVFKATATRDSEQSAVWKFEVEQYGKGYTALPYAVDSDNDSELKCYRLDLAPGLGHGADAGDELQARDVMLTSRVIPLENGFADLAVGEFSMIGLIKNPIDASTNLIGTKDYYTVAKKITCDDTALFSVNDTFFKNGDSDTAGKVIAVNGKDVYYINTGQLKKNFNDSDSIISTAHNNVIKKVTGAEIKFNSGKFLSVDYLEKALQRSKDQIESLNILLRL